MKPLTNETKKAWERELQVWDNEVDAIMLNAFKCVKHGKTLEVNMTPIRTFIDSLLQAKEGEMKEKIKSKKKYWHIRFEGISDPVISAERKKFNEEVSELINSVLDDLLSNLSK